MLSAPASSRAAPCPAPSLSPRRPPSPPPWRSRSRSPPAGPPQGHQRCPHLRPLAGPLPPALPIGPAASRARAMPPGRAGAPRLLLIHWLRWGALRSGPVRSGSAGLARCVARSGRCRGAGRQVGRTAGAGVTPTGVISPASHSALSRPAAAGLLLFARDGAALRGLPSARCGKRGEGVMERREGRGGAALPCLPARRGWGRRCPECR